MVEDCEHDLQRRIMLAKLGLGAAAIGLAAGGAVPARAQGGAAGRFQPALHMQDEWMDRIGGSHRMVFDATTPAAAGAALLYANNFFIANKNGYGLEPKDAAVIIVMRHFATPFAYTDAIWSKYGAQMAEAIEFSDPKTKQRPRTNLYTSADFGLSLPNFGHTISETIQQGVHFAVCDLATRIFATMLAEKAGGNADAVYGELTRNLFTNAHMAAAGIVAVNRAQERGYTFAYVA